VSNDGFISVGCLCRVPHALSAFTLCLEGSLGQHTTNVVRKGSAMD
jgi:hypothetical protein